MFENAPLRFCRTPTIPKPRLFLSCYFRASFPLVWRPKICTKMYTNPIRWTGDGEWGHIQDTFCRPHRPKVFLAARSWRGRRDGAATTAIPTPNSPCLPRDGDLSSDDGRHESVKERAKRRRSFRFRQQQLRKAAEGGKHMRA